MRVHDSLIGTLLLLLSLAVLWHIQGFPPPPGQPYGSALFPGLIAGALAIASLLLMWQGLRSGAPLVVPGAGWRSWRHALAFGVTLAGMVVYTLWAERLGFIPCAVLLLLALQWALGVRARTALATALLATLLIHLCFYKLLRVPLPWGLLQPIAW